MKTIDRCIVILVLASAAVLGSPCLWSAEAGAHNRALVGRIAYHYIGRVILNFANGTGIVFGYFTHLDGVPSTDSLFCGTPSEATARITFRANIRFQPLPGNGEIGGGFFSVTPALVGAGDFRVYYSANPSRNWSDPSSFSSGQLIATFDREPEQFALIGPIASNAATATLKSSAEFSIHGREFDLGDLIPRGVTNVTTGNNAALAGSTPTEPIFAFAGYALSIGK